MKTFTKYIFVTAGIATFMMAATPVAEAAWTQVSGGGARTSILNNKSGHFEIIDNFIHALGGDGAVYRWNKSITDSSPLSGSWESVAGGGGADVFQKWENKYYILGGNGAVYRWDGSWTKITKDGARSTDNFGRSGHFEIVDGFIYALGGDGAVYRWPIGLTTSPNPNDSWSKATADGGTDVFKRTQDGTYYILGMNGAVYRMDGFTWVQLTKDGARSSQNSGGKSGHFEIIGNYIYALGGNGAVYKWSKSITESPDITGGTWTEVAEGGGTDVFKKGPDEKWYIMGQNGAVFRWDEATAGPFTLTVTKTGSGNVVTSPDGINCGSDCSEAYSSTQHVTLNAVPISPATFITWGGDCAAAGAAASCSILMSAAKNVTATFSTTVSTTGGAITSVFDPATNATWTIGSTQTITWSPNVSNPGGIFLVTSSGDHAVTICGGACGTGSYPWTISGVSAGSYKVRVASSNTQYAESGVFSIATTGGVGPFTLTVSKAGTGSGTVTGAVINCGSGSGCWANFVSGTSVTLTATPSSGSTFAGWSGDCASAGTATTCALTMSAAKNATATFNTTGGANTAPFGFIDIPAGGASVSGTITVDGWVTDKEDAQVATIGFTIDGMSIATPQRYTRTDVCASAGVLAQLGLTESQCNAQKQPIGIRFSWNTSLLSNGPHAIAFAATDSGGMTANNLGARTVTVSGGSADTTPPAAITNLAASSPTASSVTLTWTSPGDDNGTGTAASYDVRYSTASITSSNWTSATQASGEPIPAVAGASQSMTVTGLSANTLYYFALKTSDEASNISAISNVANATTPSSGANTAPFGFIDIPAGGASISGTVTVEGWVADKEDKTIPFTAGRLEFLVDNATVGVTNVTRVHHQDVCNAKATELGITVTACMQLNPPLGIRFTWDTTAISNGSHTISYGVMDSGGLTATPPVGLRTVMVNNAGAPSITVISPNGGEVWYMGNTYEIKWCGSGSFPQGWSTIFLKKQDGTINTILAQPAGITACATGNNVFQWAIPVGEFFAGPDYEIEVAYKNQATGATTASDKSNAPFTIAGGFSDTTAPSVPAGLTATAISSSQINLSWTASTDTGGSGLVGYKIYRDGTRIVNRDLTYYSDTGLNPNTLYTYRISAFDNAQNESAQSSPTSATTLTTGGGNDGSATTNLVSGNNVIVTVKGNDLAVRSNPSASGSLIRRVTAGTKGTIDCSQAGGVACPTIQSGFVWWYVNYQSGADGWSAEKFNNPATGEDIYLALDTGDTIVGQCTQGEIDLATQNIRDASVLILACLSNINACTPKMKADASAKLAEAVAILADCQGGGNGGENYTVSVSPSSGAPGTNLTINWTAPSTRSTLDWVGLFRVGDGDGDTDAALEAEGNQWSGIPDDASASGVITQKHGGGLFAIPSNAAANSQYEIRYLTGSNAPYQRQAESNNITVSGGDNGGQVQLFMDPDGPGTAHQPQIGTVTSKLVLQQSPLVYHPLTAIGATYTAGETCCNSPQSTGPELLANIHWSAPAGTSCTLTETIPADPRMEVKRGLYGVTSIEGAWGEQLLMDQPTPFTFEFSGLPSSGNGYFPIPSNTHPNRYISTNPTIHWVVPYIPVNPSFTLTCGGQTSNTVTATFNADDIMAVLQASITGVPVTLQQKGYYAISSSQITGPVKVAVKAAENNHCPVAGLSSCSRFIPTNTDSPQTVFTKAYTFGNTGKPIDCSGIPTGTGAGSGQQACAFATFWSAMNATNCSITPQHVDHGPAIPPVGSPSGGLSWAYDAYDTWTLSGSSTLNPIVTSPDSLTFTASCNNPSQSGSGSVVITKSSVSQNDAFQQGLANIAAGVQDVTNKVGKLLESLSR